MNAAVQPLFTRLIDYAGLFPPARLPLDQSVRNYQTYRDSADAWMLGRFICPATRLGELAALTPQPIAVSALGRGGESPGAFHAGLLADLEAIHLCRATQGNRLAVEVFETKLPAGHDPATLLSSVETELSRFDGLETYVELPLGPNWREVVPVASQAIRDCPGVAGLKLRCGGLEPSAFPSVEQVALVLLCCRREQIRLKLTAGLHHPLRHFDASVQATMHGFVNVLAACLLAEQGAGEGDLVAVLAEEDATAFRLDDQGLHWGGYTFSPEVIRQVRTGRLTSFGSCSFDEPRDDLRALGWLS